MKKMIVSDYDDTFYLNDDDIKKNIEYVKKWREKGNLFVFATGRSYLDFNNVKNKYNLEYDYVILNHGTTLIDNSDNIVFNYDIDNKIINNIKIDVELDKAERYFCCSRLESRTDFDHYDLTKIRVRYYNFETAKRINDLINKKYSKYVNSYIISNIAIEIISNKTNKSNAITNLANMLNIEKENIFTIGDSYSDIDMINDFNGYYMKNAIDELKSNRNSEVKSVSNLIIILLNKKK